MAYLNRDLANKSAAILSLVGTINIPIIYKSVDWVLPLHQPATLKLTGPSSIDPSMAYPLLVMIAGFYCLYAWLLIQWIRSTILEHEQKTQWVKVLVLKQENHSE